MQIKMYIELIKGKFKKKDKNKWLFTSFNGSYNDSPKALSDYLKVNHPEINQVWALNNPEIDELNGLCAVRYGSIDYYKELSSSGVVIDNVRGPYYFKIYKNRLLENLKSYLKFFLMYDRNQAVYSLWHGTPLKRIDQDQFGNDGIKDVLAKNLTMFVGNQFTQRIMFDVGYHKIPTIISGMARNDCLLTGKGNRIKAKLGIPEYKKIILFAPTFRNDGVDVADKNINRSGLNQLNAIQFDQLFYSLNKKFGGEWIFICRFHYHVSSMVDWESLDEKYHGSIINGNQLEDMAEYLCCADILLTDASSSMFDFSLTDKPCFLYFPDLDNYKNRERGFYMDIEKLPYPLAVSFDDLLGIIKDYNHDEYVKRNHAFLESIGNAESGNASENIYKSIIEDTK